MKTSIAPVTVCSLLLCLAGLGASPAGAASLHQTSLSYKVGPQVDRVVVDDEIGRVVIKSGAKHRVEVVERWDRNKPEVSVSEADGAVTVEATCPSSGLVDGVVVGDNNCSVDIVITVPASADIKAATDAGAISTRDMSGRERLTTSIGDINARRATGSVVTTRSDVGDIKITVPAGAYDYRTHTDEGDVSVRGLTYRPQAKRTIAASTSTGDISLHGF